MNAVVLRLLPVSNPRELVFLHSAGMPNGASQTGFSDASLSLTVYERLKAEPRIFSALMAYVPLDTQPTAVRDGQTPDRRADMVSGDFFSGLGVRMAWGRGFTRGRRAAARADRRAQSCLLDSPLRSQGPAAIGETLYIKGVPFTIVGVTAPEFAGVSNNQATDVWIPIQTRPELKPWGRSVQSTDELLLVTKLVVPDDNRPPRAGRHGRPGHRGGATRVRARGLRELRARGEKEQAPKLYLHRSARHPGPARSIGVRSRS